MIKDIKRILQEGQILVIFLVLLLVVLLFIPVGIFFMHDSDKAGAESFANSGGACLDRAFDKAYQMLVSDPGRMALAWKGRPVPGLNNDAVIRDAESGEMCEYVVRVSSEENVRGGVWLKISGICRSAKTGATHAAQRKYRQQAVPGPVWSDVVTMEKYLAVHWGPVFAYRRVNAGWEPFPRKFSAGEIRNRDTNGQDQPNTDGVEWWSYSILPKQGRLNLAMARERAKKDGHYSAAPNAALSAGVEDADAFWFFEHNLKVTGDFCLRGFVYVGGTLELDGKGAGTGEVAVPEYAWKEYGMLDTIARDEYPGDVGFQKNETRYRFDSGRPLAVNGILMVGGDLAARGDYNLYGALSVKGEMLGPGTVTVYYNDSRALPVMGPALVPLSTERTGASWPKEFSQR